MTRNKWQTSALLAAAVQLSALLCAGPARASIMASNLGENDDNGNLSYWAATSFTTDAGTYLLDNVTLKLGPMPGTQVSVYIYDDESGVPGSQLSNGPLSGAISPPSFANYPYTPTDDVFLNPNTTYWVVRFSTENDDVRNEVTSWALTESKDEEGPWEIGDNYFYSGDGAIWFRDPDFSGMFSVSATPVEDGAIPEAGGLAIWTLLGLTISVAAWRRKSGGRESMPSNSLT